jgi:hypothetical protein
VHKSKYLNIECLLTLWTRGFTRLNITKKKTILTDSIHISADYAIIYIDFSRLYLLMMA